jgi:hypothetical protein
MYLRDSVSLSSIVFSGTNMRGRYATRLHKWIEALDGNAATSKANRCFYKDSLEKEEMGFHSFAKTCVLFDDAEFSMLRL